MNENIDLTKILKNCPKEWKLYSSIHEEVKFQRIEIGSMYPIVIKLKNNIIERFASDGKLYSCYNGECTLFPSKEQRDWSKFEAPWYKKEKFDPKTLKPFDKVLVRDFDFLTWNCDFLSYITYDCDYPYVAISGIYRRCIPYNDDTKHLVGTTDKVPEYYRYWED